jgi:hypothetical protein
LWRDVDRVIDSIDDESALWAHRLHLLAARRRRRIGVAVSPEMDAAERSAAATVLMTPGVLARVRAACDGPLVLMKGYEVACRYAKDTLRPFRDIDLLVEDPVAATRALISAGFQPTGYDDRHYDALHHVRPLFLPELPLVVELHRRPEWVRWAPAPPTELLIAGAVPSRTGVAGVLALAPAHHALALAAHSWSDLPLRRILDLVDVAVVAADAEREDVEHWAREWRLTRLWRVFERATAALFGRHPPSLPLRASAPGFFAGREATVFERHRRQLMSPFLVLPAHEAARSAATELARMVIPVGGESWRAKWMRTRHAVRHANHSLSEHARLMDERTATRR